MALIEIEVYVELNSMGGFSMAISVNVILPDGND